MEVQPLARATVVAAATTVRVRVRVSARTMPSMLGLAERLEPLRRYGGGPRLSSLIVVGHTPR